MPFSKLKRYKNSFPEDDDLLESEKLLKKGVILHASPARAGSNQFPSIESTPADTMRVKINPSKSQINFKKPPLNFI